MPTKLTASVSARKCERAPKFTHPIAQDAHVESVRSPYFDGFFANAAKAAGFSNKELQYDFRVSPTLIDLWKSGERTDPFTRAREGVESFRRKGRSDMIPSILIYIAGGYDGAVLSGEQFEALKVLTKVVKP